MSEQENKDSQGKKRRRRRPRHRRPEGENRTAPVGGEEKRDNSADRRRPEGPGGGDARKPERPAREPGRPREPEKPREVKKPAPEKRKRFPGASPLDPVYAPMSRRRRNDDLNGTPLKSGTIITEDLFPSRGDPDDSDDSSNGE